MAEKIHASKVPMVEMDFDGKVYKFVYNLATMNTISKMAEEGALPDNTDLWNEDNVRVLIHTTGMTHHPDEDWEVVLGNVSPASLLQLSNALSNMIAEENSRAYGGAVGEVESLEPTESTEEQDNSQVEV